MTPPRSHRTAPVLLVPLVGVAGLLAVTAAQPAQAEAKAKSPQLSITVDDGRADAKPGDELRYTLTVTNLGGDRVEDLRVTQTVPTGARLRSADRAGRASEGTVAWTVDVAPGRSTTVTTSLTLARELPADLLRLATVGCASTSAKAPPVVCASDSDELPAGAAAAAQQRELDPAAADDRRAWVVPAALGSGGLVVAAGLGAWATGRHRSRRRRSRGRG
jgi:uncharacterized repeat protein (TIGR01451 family)